MKASVVVLVCLVLALIFGIVYEFRIKKSSGKEYMDSFKDEKKENNEEGNK